VVFIRPILSRSASGAVVPEIGAGGGGGDLEIQALELELGDEEKVLKLVEVCSEVIVNRELRKKTLNYIDQARRSQRQSVSLIACRPDDGQMPFIELAQHLAALVDQDGSNTAGQKLLRVRSARRLGDPMERDLPRTIVCAQYA
jgi:hypothetical protein